MARRTGDGRRPRVERVGAAFGSGLSRGGGRDDSWGDVGVDGNPGELGHEGSGGGAPARRPADRNPRDMARRSNKRTRRYSVFGATIGRIREGSLRPPDGLAFILVTGWGMMYHWVFGVTPSFRRTLTRRPFPDGDGARWTSIVPFHGTVIKRHLILSLVRPMVPHGSGVQSRGDEVSGQNRDAGFASRRGRWRHWSAG